MTRIRGRLLVPFAIAIVVASCSSSDATDRAVAPSELQIVERIEWAAQFAERGVEGTFALHELGSDRVFVHDEDRARTRMLPASTFKIVNSLIALDAEVLTDIDDVVMWDGVTRPVESWNQDHSLRTGIEVSAVWVYQHLAREIGPERMQEAVDRAEYGNADISGPIDEFWLSGGLRISPMEQLDVLGRLLADDLPFDSSHQAAVREILIRERGDDWMWGHKTGTALAASPVLGWLVGYTEFDEAEWVFAMNADLGDGTDLDSQIDPQVRQSLSRAILIDAGALPPETG